MIALIRETRLGGWRHELSISEDVSIGIFHRLRLPRAPATALALGIAYHAHGEDWTELALPWREELIGMPDGSGSSPRGRSSA